MTEADALNAAMSHIAENMRKAALRALRSSPSDFALTSDWATEPQRVTYLFGKAYWWDRDLVGCLTLQPAAWINAPALRER